MTDFKKPKKVEDLLTDISKSAVQRQKKIAYFKKKKK
jgi:hypothetical protein